MAVWVKLTTALGIQSIFDTIGSHSRHRNGQYHFEVDNGRVRWFHRNEDGVTVFSVVTDQIAVHEGNWTQITGTYSMDKNRARVRRVYNGKYCAKYDHVKFTLRNVFTMLTGSKFQTTTSRTALN